MKKIFKTIIISSLILLSIVFGFFIKDNSKKSLNHFIIFNLFEKSKIKDNSIYTKIKPGTNNSFTKSLIGSINFNGLIYEKIAPGKKGEFEIHLNATYDTFYKIEFKSRNDKPKNLLFKIKNEKLKYNSLEELNNSLNGKLNKKETKVITIQWSWEYETNKVNDIQDTIDGKTIDDYYFDILIIGY